MAQQLRSCTNSTNFDTINCDSYLCMLTEKDKKIKKNAVPKQTFIRKCSKDRCTTSSTGSFSVPVTRTTSKHKSRPWKQQNVPSSIEKNGFPIIQSADNSALVEVTVRTHSSKKTSNDNLKNGPPWGKLLKGDVIGINDKLLSCFSNFDPVRTLHFLVNELQSKLKGESRDPNLLKMLAEIQLAVNRVSSDSIPTRQSLHEGIQKLKQTSSMIPEVTANRKWHKETIEIPEKLVNNKLVKNVKPFKIDKNCQTVLNNLAILDTELFQKKFEASTSKLETTCKQMEKLCQKLRAEKEQLQLLLVQEKDTVKFLRNHIAELETEKTLQMNKTFERLIAERNDLQTQLKKLHIQLDSQKGTLVQDLQVLVQDLEIEKQQMEKENLTLSHKLTVSTMENEKYRAIVTIRDRQINEIRTEMGQLQEVVNEQLVELQRSSLISTPTSQSTLFGAPWLEMNGDKVHINENSDNFLTNVKKSQKQSAFANDMQLSHFIPSGDSSLSNLGTPLSQMKKISTP